MPHLKSFDLNLLKVLDALLSESQVSAAARKVNLSQPATSAALARLRASFEDKLLVRVGSRMVLTPLAEALAPRVRRVLEDIEATLLAAGDFNPATAHRTFRIAANDYATMAVVAPSTRLIRKQAPSVTIEVLPMDGQFEEHLATNDLDLAIRDAWSLRSAHFKETLFEDDYVCIARKKHPRLSETPTLEEYLAEEHGLVSPRGLVDGTVDHVLRSLGRIRRVSVTVPHFLAAPAIVASTDLIMTVGRRTAAQIAPALSLRTFDPPFTIRPFPVAMAWPARMDGDAGARWLRERVRQASRIARA